VSHMGRRFSGYRHLIRMAILFGIGTGSFLVARAAFMPEGFGLYGHYRPGALDENRSRPTRYAGQKACLECHADVGETRAAGAHARVSCESCHGPLARHAADAPESKATIPGPRAVCLDCHTANRSKPRTFPQVVVEEHAPEGDCTACPQAHQPKVS